jgi:hypothetical protein|tara:strand:- start:76 stop:828 length:753 start_codon:yes stop_codon:yes gene_type:complete
MSLKSIFLSTFVVLLTGCGVSDEERQRLAMVACAEMKETIQMQGLERVRAINVVREKIGGEPYLEGDDEIKRSIEWGSCTLLVLDAPEYEVTTDNAEESYRLAQKEIAEEMARKREEMARKREAEFEEVKSDLRVKAKTLDITFLMKALNVAMAGVGGNVSAEVKSKSYSKVFTDVGLSKEEAAKAALVAFMRSEVDSLKNKNNLNSYGECVDKIIPNKDDIFFTITAREYKPLNYRSLLALSWDDCDAI